MDAYSKKQRSLLVASSRNLKTQLLSIVPQSARFLTDSRATKDSLEEQHRVITMIGDTCDELLSQTEEWKATYCDLLTRYDSLKGEDSDYLALQKFNSVLSDVENDLER